MLDIQKKNHIRFGNDDDDDDDENVNNVGIKESGEIGQKGKHKTTWKNSNANKPADDSSPKWYHELAEYTCNDSENEVLPLKDKEQMQLVNLCREAYDAQLVGWRKRDPSDARWLQTALSKGTVMDRVNAGALLLVSNPLGNLKVLATLTGFAKSSNKAYSELVGVVGNMWKQALLPGDRKLKPLTLRGQDWQNVRKNTQLTQQQLQNIYAQWHFEHELKESYAEFLRSMQLSLQQGQEHCKKAAILCCTDLLINAPEKESMLLSMLVNKLGDPLPKVASKALYALSEVSRRHPNMCLVIVTETEKLLFRNNVSERAVHFGLCLLATLTAHTTSAAVCSKLVQICFALFNLLVQRGAVNNRTMLAILRCLQRAINHVTPTQVGSDILTKDMQDTIYRLAHAAELPIAIQTYGLLLQLMTSPLLPAKQKDRFYNALYQQMCDLQLVNAGARILAQFLHIVHRAMHLDANVPRVQAFVKRLLQLTLYVPPHMAAACLIVIHKLQRTRRQLFTNLMQSQTSLPQFDNSENTTHDDKFEKSTTTTTTTTTTTPITAELLNNDKDMKRRNLCTYDAYNRTPSYAGAEYVACHELLFLAQHFHPTVQVLTESIQKKTKLTYFGDPLQDFSLTRFLERFVFKNPKKSTKGEDTTAANANRRSYKPMGARGQPIKSLTSATCTEDEAFIFNFMEQERRQREESSQSRQDKKGKKDKKKSKGKDADDDDDNSDDEEILPKGDVNDDEFDDYLHGFFGKKAQKANNENDDGDGDGDDDDGEDDDEDGEKKAFEFLKALDNGNTLKEKNVKGKKEKPSNLPVKTKNDNNLDDEDNSDVEFSDDDLDSMDLDHDDDDDDLGTDNEMADDDDDDDDDKDEESDDSNEVDDSDEEDEPGMQNKLKVGGRSGTKRGATIIKNDESFTKKLKRNKNMSSLFAAADDFAMMLEESGEIKGQGTSNAVDTKGSKKITEKQRKWENKRSFSQGQRQRKSR